MEWSGMEWNGVERSGVEWSGVVVVAETAAIPSRFAYFWQGAESLAPAKQNHI